MADPFSTDSGFGGMPDDDNFDAHIVARPFDVAELLFRNHRHVESPTILMGDSQASVVHEVTQEQEQTSQSQLSQSTTAVLDDSQVGDQAKVAKTRKRFSYAGRQFMVGSEMYLNPEYTEQFKALLVSE
jgi:hypothetical protein